MPLFKTDDESLSINSSAMSGIAQKRTNMFKALLGMLIMTVFVLILILVVAHTSEYQAEREGQNLEANNGQKYEEQWQDTQVELTNTDNVEPNLEAQSNSADSKKKQKQSQRPRKNPPQDQQPTQQDVSATSTTESIASNQEGPILNPAAAQSQSSEQTPTVTATQQQTPQIQQQATLASPDLSFDNLQSQQKQPQGKKQQEQVKVQLKFGDSWKWLGAILIDDLFALGYELAEEAEEVGPAMDQSSKNNNIFQNQKQNQNGPRI